ncbi:hypothetical protein D3C71_872410 [compost metagenome]
MRAPVLRMLCEAHHLDRQHRKHAGHEVEDEPAKQGAQQRGREGEGRGAGGCGRRCRAASLRRIGFERGLQRGRHAGNRRALRPGAQHLQLCAVAGARVGASGMCGRLLGQHHGHQAGAGAALGRQGNLRGPHAAVPGLLPLRSVVDDLGGFGEQVQRPAAQRHGQALHADVQQVAVGNLRLAVRHDAVGACQHGLGLGPGGRLKGGTVERRGALDGQLQREFAFFGNALLAAHQPGGAQLDRRVLGQRAGGKTAGHGDGHGQQHRAFVAIVGQRADGDLLGQGPGDLARVQTGWQRPGQVGGQARIARVLPVGVPLGLVGDREAQPQRLAGRHALGRMGQQLGANIGRGDHAGALSAGFGAKLGVCAHP